MDVPPNGQGGQRPGVLRLNADAKPFVPTNVTASGEKDGNRNKSIDGVADGATARSRGSRGGNTKKGQQGSKSGAPRGKVKGDKRQPSRRGGADSALKAHVESPKKGSSALTEQGRDLARKLESGQYECMICMTVVGKKAKVWSCSFCFVVLHLGCTETWAVKSGEGGSWRCPHCQHIMLENPRHVCYCGRMVRPDADPYLVVGSCGEVCEKVRVGTDCPHTCNLTCHPGPCPPCPLMGPERTCHCGRRKYALKCSEVEPNGSSCGTPCGKPLPCGLHTCQQSCHSGICSPCGKTEAQVCFCGRVTADRPCGSGVRVLGVSESGEFSCGSLCGRSLPCGIHHCENICHIGACQECPTAPSRVTHCPCGAQPLMAKRRQCTDPILCCKGKCNRMHPLCRHPCESVCHEGPCPPCALSRTIQCRCGSSKKEVACASMEARDAEPIRSALEFGETPRLLSVLCHQRCSTLKNCGRHRCEVICCPSFRDQKNDVAGMHICRLPCHRPMDCKNPQHRCPEICHKGKCAPCLQAVFDEWSCPCGKTRVLPPIRCGQKMPTCPHVCLRGPRPCGHVDSLPHQCHPDSEPCPPCVKLVDTRCVCSAELRHNVRCHLADNVSCGKVCDASLLCGLHRCTQQCHIHAADESFVFAGCGQPCGKSLECGHPCPSPCHPSRPDCPSVTCTRKISITCACGRQAQPAVCNHVHKGADAQVLAHPRPECDDLCAREQRKRALAEAFGKQHTQWQEQQIALGLARTHPTFLRRAETQLSSFISRNANFSFPGSDDGGVIIPNLVFPSATPTQRKLLHHLASQFGLASESYGDEGHRSVWITLTPNAKLPARYLSSILDEQQAPVEAKGYRAAECGVLLSELPDGMRTPHLEKVLQPWKGQYVLHWLDDHAALAVFDEPGQARLVINTLRGPFVAKMFREELLVQPLAEIVLPSDVESRPRSDIASNALPTEDIDDFESVGAAVGSNPVSTLLEQDRVVLSEELPLAPPVASWEELHSSGEDVQKESISKN